MEFISPEDFLEIRFASILTDFDRKIVCELYQPLIGHSALAVYFTLWSEHERYLDVFTHDHLFAVMQINAGAFTKAKAALEAVGLLKTYYKKENEIRYFIYELYAPKTPFEFFDDALFSGLLNKYLGEKEARRLSTYFKDEEKPHDYRDVTASFIEVFNPNFDDPAFKLGQKNDAKGRVVGKATVSFDFNVFFNEIKDKGALQQSALSQPQLTEIERIAMLYGIDEESMANLVLHAYHPEAVKEERIDFYRLGTLCREETKYKNVWKSQKGANSLPTSSTAIAEKIKLMEESSPKDYLRFKQNNTIPTKPDLVLIDDISSKLGLTNPVINALVDYVLEVNKNVLSRALTEKIGASLAREQVATAIDAMNFLRKIHNSTRRGAKTTAPEPEITPKSETVPMTKPDEEISPLWDKYKKKNEEGK